MNENEIRNHVRKLRNFYKDVAVYLVVNFFLIIIWLLSGVGYFWPIWVILGWGIGLGIHALSIGLAPQLTAMLPFMREEWEDEEVKRMMKNAKSEEKKNTD